MQESSEPRYKHGYVYDIESYPNFFSITLYSLVNENYLSYYIYKNAEGEYIGDKLTEIKEACINKTLIGYNNWHYDDKMLDYIFRYDVEDPEDINEFSNKLIKDKSFKYKLPYEDAERYFYSYDLMEIIRAGFNSSSLKSVGVNLKYHKLQELPIDPTTYITKDQINLLLDYNENDVELTTVLLDKLEEDLLAREQLSQLFQIDLRSQSKSGITKKIFTKLYKDRYFQKYNRRVNLYQNKSPIGTSHNNIPLASIVHPYVKFRTQRMKAYFDQMMTLDIELVERRSTSDKYKLSLSPLIFDGVEYSIGLGGIHSKDHPVLLDTEDDHIILDLDVTSQYPSCILNNKIAPAHLDSEIILGILQYLKDTRVQYKTAYKKEGNRLDDLKQYGLKIAINTFYGLLNSKTYWLFDPRCTFEVTINNQLAMLMLIEKLYLYDISVISANTDGITIYAPVDKLGLIRKLYKEWETVTKFQLEETFYTLYARRDVSNYLAICDNGKVKQKGLFEIQDGDTSKLHKGFEFPIIAKLLNLYFTNQIKPEVIFRELEQGNETVLTQYGIDIFDFCATRKVDAKFTNELHKQFVIKKKTKDPNGLEQYKKPHYTFSDILKDYSLDLSEDRDIDDPYIYEVLPLPRTIRYYIAAPLETYYSDAIDLEIGNVLYKTQMVDDTVKQQHYHRGYYVEIFNDYLDKSFISYNINYQFYIDEIYKVLNDIYSDF